MKFLSWKIFFRDGTRRELIEISSVLCRVFSSIWAPKKNSFERHKHTQDIRESEKNLNLLENFYRFRNFVFFSSFIILRLEFHNLISYNTRHHDDGRNFFDVKIFFHYRIFQFWWLWCFVDKLLQTLSDIKISVMSIMVSEEEKSYLFLQFPPRRKWNAKEIVSNFDKWIFFRFRSFPTSILRLRHNIKMVFMFVSLSFTAWCWLIRNPNISNCYNRYAMFYGDIECCSHCRHSHGKFTISNFSNQINLNADSFFLIN